jgi:glycosyltransferase involved in cell wall biosynthesis
MRQLLPTRLYPGHRRVGAPISRLRLPSTVRYYDGIDWFWVPSLFKGMLFLLRQRPSVLILQWWSGTVLHTYLALTLVARLLGSRVVVEFHEVLDPSEDSMPLVSHYVRAIAPWLFRLAHGYVVHSMFDRDLIVQRYGHHDTPMAIIPHATYDHYRKGARWRAAPEGICNLLFFGLIRPYKGLDDLIRAFDSIPPDRIDEYWLTIVGETWGGWTLPGDLVAQSRYRDRITFINRYVSDDEVDGIFAGADVALLPYRRSSQSGALHIAMHYGLPVIVTAVGGLVEAVGDYEGAIVIEPENVSALNKAIEHVVRLRDRRYPDPRGWGATADRYGTFLSHLTGATAHDRPHVNAYEVAPACDAAEDAAP